MARLLFLKRLFDISELGLRIQIILSWSFLLVIIINTTPLRACFYFIQNFCAKYYKYLPEMESLLKCRPGKIHASFLFHAFFRTCMMLSISILDYVKEHLCFPVVISTNCPVLSEHAHPLPFVRQGAINYISIIAFRTLLLLK